MIINVERMATVEIQTEQEMNQLYAMAMFAKNHLEEHPPQDNAVAFAGHKQDVRISVDDLEEMIELLIRETS